MPKEHRGLLVFLQSLRGISAHPFAIVAGVMACVLLGISIRDYRAFLGVIFGTLSSLFIAAPTAYLTMGRTIKDEEVPATK